tara:strand:+ start:61 stop:336 length:276 start_codon:yes stop_codon:yes gene_type:complete
MFSILTQRLKSLSGHTAVLEACGWDEDLMLHAFDDLNVSVSSCSGLSMNELADHLRKDLRKKGHDDMLIKQLLRLVQTEVENEINNLRGEA